MFIFFKKKKFKADVKKLEENLVIFLSDIIPEIAEQYLHCSTHTSTLTADRKINILHSFDDDVYYRNNFAKNNQHYILDGIEILNKKNGTYTPIQLTICYNLISWISVPFEKSLRKEFDLSVFRLNQIQRKDFKLKNQDVNKLNKILSALSKDEKDRLEIFDTMELELDGKLFYTILDLEDGNYIAVNKAGNVFRLLHDHEMPVKKIFPTVKEFLKSYSGDKEDLEKLF